VTPEIEATIVFRYLHIFVEIAGIVDKGKSHEFKRVPGKLENRVDSKDSVRIEINSFGADRYRKIKDSPFLQYPGEVLESFEMSPNIESFAIPPQPEMFERVQT
jgi:hypothetical protein